MPCKPSQSSPKPAVPAVPDSGQLAMSELTRTLQEDLPLAWGKKDPRRPLQTCCPRVSRYGHVVEDDEDT